MIWDIVRDVSGESLEVCVFVVLMMSLVEALNLGADTPFFKKFRKSGIGQVGLGGSDRCHSGLCGRLCRDFPVQ